MLSKYSHIRRTRPDGNCFFRAFCYAYLERLIKNKDEFKEFIERVQSNQAELIKMGFPQFTVEDFYETVSEIVEDREICLVLHTNDNRQYCNLTSDRCLICKSSFDNKVMVE